jgi:hypothetical protein
LTGVVISGLNSASPATGGVANQTSFYVGATANTPVAGLKVGASYDYAGVSHQPPLHTDEDKNPVGPGYANATALYASYQATEKLTFNARGEYASSGSSVFLARKVFAATATVQYDLWKNVMSRIEFRWDHAADGSSPFGGTVAGEEGDKKNSYILLANIAYKF